MTSVSHLEALPCWDSGACLPHNFPSLLPPPFHPHGVIRSHRLPTMSGVALNGEEGPGGSSAGQEAGVSHRAGGLQAAVAEAAAGALHDLPDRLPELGLSPEDSGGPAGIQLVRDDSIDITRHTKREKR